MQWPVGTASPRWVWLQRLLSGERGEPAGHWPAASGQPRGKTLAFSDQVCRDLLIRELKPTADVSSLQSGGRLPRALSLTQGSQGSGSASDAVPFRVPGAAWL